MEFPTKAKRNFVVAKHCIYIKKCRSAEEKIRCTRRQTALVMKLNGLNGRLDSEMKKMDLFVAMM